MASGHPGAARHCSVSEPLRLQRKWISTAMHNLCKVWKSNLLHSSCTALSHVAFRINQALVSDHLIPAMPSEMTVEAAASH